MINRTKLFTIDLTGALAAVDLTGCGSSASSSAAPSSVSTAAAESPASSAAASAVVDNAAENGSDALDAYRRADRIERNARERAELVYHQASAVLSEAIARVDATTAEITAKADDAMSQLTQLQMAVSASKQALQDASSLMNTIRPNF